MVLKRKSEFAFEQSKMEGNKRCRREMKKSTREQERILLENFVKYGILPTSTFGRKESSIQVRIPSPLSPLKTPVRPQSNSSPCTVMQNVARTLDTGKTAKQSVKFWRPWVKNPSKGEEDLGQNIETSGRIIAEVKQKKDQERLHYKKRELRKFCTPKQTLSPQEKIEKSKQVSPQMRIPAPADRKTVLHYRPQKLSTDLQKCTPQQSWNPAHPHMKSSISLPQRRCAYNPETPRSHPGQQSYGRHSGAQNQANYYLEAMNHIMAQQRHLAASRCVPVFN